MELRRSLTILPLGLLPVPVLVGLLLLVLMCVQPAGSLQCVRCDTNLDPDCANQPKLELTNCTADMKYCIVYYSVFKSGDAVVFRDCNDVAVNKCSYKTISGQRVNICYETCDQDACNTWAVSMATSNNRLVTRGVARALPWILSVASLIWTVDR